MKKKSIIVPALIFIAVVSIFGFKFQESAFTDFYYYQGKPFKLIQIPDAIFLELDENVTETLFNNLLSEFPALYVKQTFSLVNKKDFIYVHENLDNDGIQNLIKKLNSKTIVVNASPVFKLPDGKGSSKVMIGVEKEIIAQFKPVISSAEINSYLIQKGMSIVQQFDLSGGETYLIKIPEDQYSIDYANELYLTGLVNYSEPNLFFTNLLQVPNDPLFTQQWAHKNTGNNIPGGVVGISGCDMRTDSAWGISMGSPNVIVSIVDTGIDTLHEDLSSRIINGLSIDTYNNLPYAWDDYNHGTACAGIVAATGNNNIGVIGVAPESRIFGVKIFNSAGSTNSTAIINGLIAAWQRGSWVSSNSWGGGSPVTAADNAISDGVNFGRNGKGVIWSFAAGNDNSSLSWPSTNTNVLSVGGLAPCNQRKSPSSCDGETWWGANYGTGLEIVAPAVKIYTTDRSGSVGYTTGNYVSDFNGTSSATPNASGVAALILSVDSSLTWQQVRERICLTADKVGSYTYNQPGQLGLGGWNNEMGYGKINAYEVLKQTVLMMGPSITHTALPNTEQTTGNYVVNCSITPNGSPLNLSEIKLLWSKNSVSITDSIIMNNTGGNNFTGNIPSTGTGLYRYYIKSKDNLNRTTTSPLSAPANVYSFSAIMDVTPPVITHTPISNTAQTRWPINVSASVTDSIGVQSVQCEFRVNSGAINTFSMSLLSGTTYQGAFTGSVNVNDIIEYRIKATDNSLQNNIAYNPSSGFNSFTIIASLGNILVVDDDVTLEGRISNDKPGRSNYIISLSASANLFNSTLTSAGYVVDQVTFSSLNMATLSNYDVVILSAGVNESTMFNDAAKRTALVNYTLSGGKTLVEGGEVGYIYRKSGTTTDLDPPFRRNLLLDSTWISDRIGANLQIATASHSIFNIPNVITSPITVNNGGSAGYGARDEMTILPGVTGISRIANWVGGTTANGGIFLYNPGGDTSVCRNIFFSFSLGQLADQTAAANLIVNAVRYLTREFIPITKSFNITAIIEGLWNGSSMISDSITVEMRGTSSPYNIIESKKIVLNTSGTGTGLFTLVSNGTPYYIVLKHRNSIETWSAAGQQFSANNMIYDFTSSQNKAYQNNLVLKGNKWCIYSGDVNQDGFVNSVDVNSVFLDNQNGVEGYTSTDLNGDLFTEIGDIGIVFTNSALNIERKKP